jgi:hypothetical protein
METVIQAVKEVFGPLNPREDITLERLAELILEVRKKVEGATEEERRYVFPWLMSYLRITNKIQTKAMAPIFTSSTTRRRLRLTGFWHDISIRRAINCISFASSSA